MKENTLAAFTTIVVVVLAILLSFRLGYLHREKEELEFALDSPIVVVDTLGPLVDTTVAVEKDTGAGRFLETTSEEVRFVEEKEHDLGPLLSDTLAEPMTYLTVEQYRDLVGTKTIPIPEDFGEGIVRYFPLRDEAQWIGRPRLKIELVKVPVPNPSEPDLSTNFLWGSIGLCAGILIGVLVSG